MKRLPSLLHSRTVTRRRRAVAAALLAVVAAGAVLAGLASTGGAAAPKSALARATSVDDVVAQVRNSFGDQQIVSASVEGPLLSVTLNLPGTNTPGYGVKGIFEGQVLGSGVADWMRSQGQQPITTVRYRDTQGKIILGTPTYGEPVKSDPNVSPLPADGCDTAAKAAGSASLTLVSAQTLPYLNGTCVFTFKASDLQTGSEAAMAALGRMISAIGGPPNERPWLFELDDQNGVPKTGASWMPGENGDVGATGTTWATPGLAYPLSHG